MAYFDTAASKVAKYPIKSSLVMAKKTAANGMSFAQSCEYLSLSPDQLVTLRDKGLVACLSQGTKLIYPTAGLDITRRLLKLGQERGWEYETLAWYADLLFAAEVGRAILLPIHDGEAYSTLTPASWLETPYAIAVLDDLNQEPEKNDAAIVALLRSLIAVAIDEDQFWSDLSSLEQSALYSIIVWLEESGVPILGQRMTIARDALNNYALIVLAFGRIAPPISREFMALVQIAQSKLKSGSPAHVSTSSDEQDIILKQPLIPIDKIYASKATEIHSSLPSELWDFKLGLLKADRRTIAVQIKLPLDVDQPFIDNILDMIRPFIGSFGARVVHLLYEVANDPPYFRNPVVTVDTNDLLDRLGLKRDKNGFHRSKNRERLRDALNAAHALEIVGEYTTWEKGTPVVKAFYRTVLSLIGATFDPSEREGISTAELRTRGLPKSVQIRLNFYDGIRRPDGTLGNQFVLVPRLTAPNKLLKANYSATHEALKAYLLFRYRQTQMESRTLALTRQIALEKANITNKNPRMATVTLRKALDHLVADNTLQSYTFLLPNKSHESFEVTLSEEIIDGFKP